MGRGVGGGPLCVPFYSPCQGNLTNLATQGGVTIIDSIVTAATALVNPCTKEGVELLHLLPYTPVNVCIVNGQGLKFNAVKGQIPKISMVNG